MGTITKVVVALGAVLTMGSVCGQTPPNMDAIRDSITNPSSTFYYDRLFERYELMDSTLSFDDYFYLYYGYAEQVNYMPLLDNTVRAELEEILSGRTTPSHEDYQRAIVLLQTLLSIEPFNLRDINALAYVNAVTGNEQRAEKIMQRVDAIAQVILSTGDGMSEESPWWITYFAHAEDIVNLKGLTQQGVPIIVSSSVEFMPTVKQKGKKDKGYYFNYSLIYAKEPDYLENVKGKRRKMIFNPQNAKPDFKY